mgnify:CR=1 FL=1
MGSRLIPGVGTERSESVSRGGSASSFFCEMVPPREGRQLGRILLIPPPRVKPRETSNHVETRRHSRSPSSFLRSCFSLSLSPPSYFRILPSCLSLFSSRAPLILVLVQPLSLSVPCFIVSLSPLFLRSTSGRRTRIMHGSVVNR